MAAGDNSSRFFIYASKIMRIMRMCLLTRPRSSTGHAAIHYASERYRIVKSSFHIHIIHEANHRQHSPWLAILNIRWKKFKFCSMRCSSRQKNLYLILIIMANRPRYSTRQSRTQLFPSRHSSPHHQLSWSFDKTTLKIAKTSLLHL